MQLPEPPMGRRSHADLIAMARELATWPSDPTVKVVLTEMADALEMAILVKEPRLSGLLSEPGYPIVESPCPSPNGK
jgi:hypothetical protein